MSWKKFGKALLFPHIAVMLVLLPVATAFLVVSMVVIGTETVPAYMSYVLATYTLTVWCARMPRLISFVKHIKADNKYARRWFEDAHLRVKLSLYVSCAWNVAYAAFQFWLGYLHQTHWYVLFGVYYLLLAVMRFLLSYHTRKFKPGERMRAELVKYRFCAYVFLVMNVALSLVIFFMIYWGRTFEHDEITTITMAAYTFTTLTFGIMNVIKYRKYNSPIYSASKAISLASASVSMLTLESTMLTTFSDGTMNAVSRKMLLGFSGGAIAAFIVVMAIYMIVRSTKKLKQLKIEEQTNGERS